MKIEYYHQNYDKSYDLFESTVKSTLAVIVPSKENLKNHIATVGQTDFIVTIGIAICSDNYNKAIGREESKKNFNFVCVKMKEIKFSDPDKAYVTFKTEIEKNSKKYTVIFTLSYTNTCPHVRLESAEIFKN